MQEKPSLFEGIHKKAKTLLDSARIALRRGENNLSKNEQSSLDAASEAVIKFMAGSQESLASFADPSILDLRRYNPGAILRIKLLTNLENISSFYEKVGVGADVLPINQNITNVWYVIGHSFNDKESLGQSLYRIEGKDPDERFAASRSGILRLSRGFVLNPEYPMESEIQPSLWHANLRMEYAHRYFDVDSIDIMTSGTTSKQKSPELDGGLKRLVPSLTT